MSLTFRYVDPPEQTNVIDVFSQLSAETLNETSRILLIPFFYLSNSQIPNIVAPGGYGNRITGETAECFAASYTGTILTLGPGYCVIDEILFDFKYEINIDLAGSAYYIDEFTTDGSIGRVYAVAYYNPTRVEGQYGTRITFSNSKSAYIGIITNPNSFYYNQSKYCFLYYIDVDISGGVVSKINGIYYRDPDISYMRRKIPDSGII